MRYCGNSNNFTKKPKNSIIYYIFEDLLCKKYSDIENTPADMQFYQIKCNIINYNYTKTKNQ